MPFPLSTLPLMPVVAAQSPAPAAAAAPVGCKDDAHRAIGYWVGDWSVRDTKSGTPIAQSRIEWILDGCGIRESYSQTVGPGGVALNYHGSSQTALDAASGQWRQFSIDSTGNTSNLSGKLPGGRLVMQADKSGGINRMTIQALPDGNVSQRGDRSTDGGKTWTPGYDFTYVRKP